MSLTPSNQINIGSEAPTFSLPDVSTQKTVSFNDVRGENGTVVMFICNHCPFVQLIEDELAEIAADYEGEVGFVAISSNDAENYEDSPEDLRGQISRAGFMFPYLYDEDQSVAKTYDAACTPDIYVFDEDDALFYHGQIDSSRPGNDEEVTGGDLREALDLLIDGDEPPEEQIPSTGCNIKWK